MTFAFAPERYPSRRSMILARNGMVSTSQPLAARAGLQVLCDGGNAVDAAITAAGVLAVVEPFATGIGGDCFALVYEAKTGQVHALNGSGRAPQALTLDVFRQRGLTKVPTTGMLPVTVPGAVHAWSTLLERFGTLSLADALGPAISYAEEGYPISEVVAGMWNDRVALLRASPDATAQYLIDGERAPRLGEIVRLPTLADSLRTIAADGPMAFYQGAIGQALVQFSTQNGGFLSLSDLAGHSSTWVSPISLDYRGYRVYECPPNGQGLAALMALNICQGYDLSAMDPDSAGYFHILIEAARLGLCDGLVHFADPEHVKVPVERLLSPEHAQSRRQLIRTDRTIDDLTVGRPAGEGTVYVAVVDGQGNACSFINSIFQPFGSGMVAGQTGIILHNRGIGFVLDPDHPNCWAPGKRPYHTIIPGLITHRGALYACFGLMGGFIQAQGHLQAVSRLIDHRQSPQQALDAPRFRVTDDLNHLYLERAVPSSIAQDLAAMGHRITPAPEVLGTFGGGQIILVDSQSGVLCAGSDPRKDGCALGY